MATVIHVLITPWLDSSNVMYMRLPLKTVMKLQLVPDEAHSGYCQIQDAETVSLSTKIPALAFHLFLGIIQTAGSYL